MTGPAEALHRILEVLNQLGIPYMVAGSVATSIHGIPRTTRDVDLVAAIRPEHIAPLSAELRTEFYADPEMMREALRAGRMFNLIHYGSSYKFDVYPLSSESYYQTAFARRKMEEHVLEGQKLRVYVESPEDAILAKLVWYRSGNEVSERQWSDVLDVCRVKRDVLDLSYLRHWAGPLGVVDLLEEALSS